MANSSNDEFMEELEDIFGLEGYARWWKLLEAVAEKMDGTNKCSARYSWVKWQTILKGKRNKLRTFLEHLENESKINLEETGNILEIKIPKLLKFRDEYSKKSGHTTDDSPDNVSPIEYRVQSIEEDKTLKTLVPSIEHPPDENIIDQLILKDKSVFFVEKNHFQQWTDLFPDVDVSQEIRHMKTWLTVNPRKRKTRTGILRFCNSWLTRAQTQGARHATNQQRSGKNLSAVERVDRANRTGSEQTKNEPWIDAEFCKL